MKPRNFPARKLARKIAADIRADGMPSTASYVLIQQFAEVANARTVRTKKRRIARRI
jgi:hypothetical protein